MICPKCKINEKWKEYSYCQSCLQTISKSYRNKNIDKARLRETEYRNSHRKQKSDYYKNWYKKNGRKRTVNSIEIIKRWRKNNHKKLLAQWKLRYAVRIKKVKKSKKCNMCDRKTKLFGHHKDYNKPLEVIWLCGSCHKLIHSRLTNYRKKV